MSILIDRPVETVSRADLERYARSDLGRSLRSLATSVVLGMGEGKEQQPLALITNAPVEFTDKINKKELYIDPKKDLYLPFFKNLGKKKV